MPDDFDRIRRKKEQQYSALAKKAVFVSACGSAEQTRLAKFVVLRGRDSMSLRYFDLANASFTEATYFTNYQTAQAFARIKSDLCDCICTVWRVPQLMIVEDAR